MTKDRLDSRWIAYVGPFRFPQGEAGSQRVYGIARSLVAAGYSVTVGSGEALPSEPIQMEEVESGGLFYLGLGEIPSRASSLAIKAIRWYATLGRRTIAWLDRQPILPVCVISCGDHAPLLLRLQTWCRRHNVPLISDVVEWYNSRHVQGGMLGPSNLSAKLTLRLLYPRSAGIIAISSFLENYYQRHGCHVLRIPPTLDVQHTKPNLSVRRHGMEGITLAYAGMMGKKDLMNNVIEAILQIDSTGRRVRLTMAGPEISAILALPALSSRGYSSLPDCVQVLGPQSHSRALDLVRNSDFMPLLRPRQRYAQAGFPTKIVESLAVATPVICNLTSDLGDYIHDGCEGLVCRDYSAESFAAALERAMSLTPGQRGVMRQLAREQAVRSFDYRAYAGQLDAFLNQIVSPQPA